MLHRNVTSPIRLFAPTRRKALLIALASLVAGPALATDPAPALFGDAETTALGDLPSKASGVLAALERRPTTKRFRLVTVQSALLDSPGPVALNLFPDAAASIAPKRVERKDERLTWFGTSSSPDTSAIFVVHEGMTHGTVREGGRLYRVVPLTSSLHAIVEVDETQFPEDEPPGFHDEPGAGGTPSPPAFDEPPTEEGDAFDDGSVFTVLVAYTADVAAATANVEGLIHLAIEETNQSFLDSGVQTRAQLVHSYQTGYEESGDIELDMDRLVDPGDGHLDEAHLLRDLHAADVGMLLVEDPGLWCGLAAGIAVGADMAFAVTGRDCATGHYTFGHEIGHLFGARHNPEADPSTEPFAHGHGYYFQPGAWRTVMSYDCPGGCTRLPQWSNPDVLWNGDPTGTVATHHNARVLNERAAAVANFRAEERRYHVLAIHHPEPAHPNYTRTPTGDPAEVAELSTGYYRVTLPGLSDLPGGKNVQVNAWGLPGYCNVVDWAGDDVRVQCYDSAGVPAGAFFTVYVAGDEDDAFVWADQPTSSYYEPHANWAQNPAGAAPTATRHGAGDYTVSFPGLSSIWAIGNVQVTAYGHSNDARCKVRSWGSESVNVLCWTPGGAPADSKFSLLATRNQNDGWAWADKPTTASYTASASYANSPDGDLPTIEREAVGTYTVTFSGMLPGIGGNAIATAYGAGSEHCHIGFWEESSARVLCYDAGGDPKDTKFVVRYAKVESSALGGAACEDGVDNDNDGTVDLDDPGCDAASDPSERTPALVCDNGIDDDGDGGIDYDVDTAQAILGQGVYVPPGDAGCLAPDQPPVVAGQELPETRACENNLDDDGDGEVDWVAIRFYRAAMGNQPPELDGVPPDPHCASSLDLKGEIAGGRCGLGFECGLLAGLWWLVRRRGPSR